MIRGGSLILPRSDLTWHWCSPPSPFSFIFCKFGPGKPVPVHQDVVRKYGCVNPIEKA